MEKHAVILTGAVDGTWYETSLDTLVVRPIVPGEEDQWDALMAAHHYLGFEKTLIGHSIKYVAILDGQWVALIGWGAAALKLTCRDQWIGWSAEQKMQRLKYVVNNQRFLILPGIQIKNLASKVLALNTSRLSSDWQAAFGHPVLMVETFVDPKQFEGTSYKAAGWKTIGQTTGYGRKSGKYIYHGEPKTVFTKCLERKVRKKLSSEFMPPLDGSESPVDLNQAQPGWENSLLAYLARITDPRHARGIRHNFLSVIAMAICAIMAGKHDYIQIFEWVESLSQDTLKRLGARRDPRTGLYVSPSEPTFRRTLQAVDGEEVDCCINMWLLSQAGNDVTGVAIDGKAVKGSKWYRGKPLHLVAAFLHKQAITIAQTEVDTKTNEINAFRPLLENVDIEGMVATADAMHCQVKHAYYIVDEKHADYIFQVKQNQPTIFDIINEIPLNEYSEETVVKDKGHGRTEERSVRTTTKNIGNIDFPYVAQIIRVERTTTKIKSGETSHEIAFYITSLSFKGDRENKDDNKANGLKLGDLIRGHWSIENRLHWVRDVICGEDDSKIGKGSGPRVLASFTNLALGLFRFAKKKCMAKEFRRCNNYKEAAVLYLGL
ncbi:MAG: ISAs1 family transposase [Peptococcaceae bacterium]|jgi:predicted transposase YbfD/YdcC|nr:ISAs1 family transposase [Peptococcaceae bacterium]